MVRWQITAVLSAAAAVAITGAALVSDGGRIAADLDRRATEALAPEVTSWASVTMDGRDAVLVGAAPSEDLRRLAADRVGRIFGVRTVDVSATRLLPEADPYAVVLERDGAVLTITGSAPSQPDRRRMVDALTRAVPNLAYNDRLTLARGMPDAAFVDALGRLYPLLGEISAGKVALTGRTVAVEAVAASNAAYGRLSHLDLSLPNGYELAGVTLTRPRAAPFVWSAESSGRDVTLTGFAPDPDTRMRLYGVVRDGQRSGPVVDRVDLASGAPPHFAEVAAEAADFLDLFAYGTVGVKDRSVSIAGVAATPESYRTANAYLAAFKPEGYTVDAKVGLPVVSPFTLSATRSRDRVTVTGFVPSQDDAGLVKAAAVRIGGQKAAVVETTVAAGAPPGFRDAALFALAMLESLTDGTVVVSDKTITISGAARSGADLLDVEASAVSRVPDGFAVKLAVTPPVVSPYVWAIEKTADSIVITGSVPSERVRAAIRAVVEDAAGDGYAVLDRTQLAAGLPREVDLEAVARFAVRELDALKTGFLTLNDARLSMIGAAPDARKGMIALGAMDDALPSGVEKGMSQVDFPPAFHLEIDRGGDAVTIDGTTADDAMTAAVSDAVRTAFGTADVEMNLEPMDGLPDRARDAALLAVRAASLLATGKVKVEGTVIQVQGKAYTGIGAVRLSSDLAADMPQGFRLDSSVGVARSGPPLAPAECQADLTAVLATAGVSFTPTGAVATMSHGLLDRLGAEAMRCTGVRFVVEGRADPATDPAAAAAEAEGRAKAVARFLADVGVDPAKLEAVGAPAGTAPPAGVPGGAVAIRVEPATTP